MSPEVESSASLLGKNKKPFCEPLHSCEGLWNNINAGCQERYTQRYSSPQTVLCPHTLPTLLSSCHVSIHWYVHIAQRIPWFLRLHLSWKQPCSRLSNASHMLLPVFFQKCWLLGFAAPKKMALCVSHFDQCSEKNKVYVGCNVCQKKQMYVTSQPWWIAPSLRPPSHEQRGGQTPWGLCGKLNFRTVHYLSIPLWLYCRYRFNTAGSSGKMFLFVCVCGVGVFAYCMCVLSVPARRPEWSSVLYICMIMPHFVTEKVMMRLNASDIGGLST